MVKNLPANAGGVRDTGSVPGLEKSPGEGHGNPLLGNPEISRLGNPMERGTWQVVKSWI